MKKFSVRKIVLSSIGLFASIMLLVGLAFNVIAYEMAGLSGSASSAVSSALGVEANGFTMLSFELPTYLRAIILTYMEEDLLELFEVLLGVTSLLSLIVSIGSMVLIVLAFLRSTSEKNEKAVRLTLIAGIIVSAVHGILAIVFKSIVQSSIDEWYEELNASLGQISSSLGTAQSSLGEFTSVAFISIIFQAVCLTAYIICSKKIKEKEVAPVVATKTGADASKEDVKNKEATLENLIASESEIAKLLTEYKDLYESQIISTADYMDKKVKLLRFSEKRVKSRIASIINKCSFESIIKMEKQVVNVLKEYDKLAKSGVISDSDFVEKKASLLASVIN